MYCILLEGFIIGKRAWILIENTLGKGANKQRIVLIYLRLS